MPFHRRNSLNFIGPASVRGRLEKIPARKAAQHFNKGQYFISPLAAAEFIASQVK
jgi:hypothetical protein